jgi:hypothetical protein
MYFYQIMVPKTFPINMIKKLLKKLCTKIAALLLLLIIIVIVFTKRLRRAMYR